MLDFSTFSSHLRITTKHEMPTVRSQVLQVILDAYLETFGSKFVVGQNLPRNATLDFILEPKGSPPCSASNHCVLRLVRWQWYRTTMTLIVL